MIYVVSKHFEKFTADNIQELSVYDSLSIINRWRIIQINSILSGENPHLHKLLFFQFSDKETNTQIIVDCESYSILLYKDILEHKFLVGYNINSCIQFLYNYNIIPKRIFDVSSVEFILSEKKYNLLEIISNRLNIDVKKSFIEKESIKYEITTTICLEDVMNKQIQECQKKQLFYQAKEACNNILVDAYMNWCASIPKENKKEELPVTLIMRDVLKDTFNWIINNGYFKKICFHLESKIDLICNCPEGATKFQEVFNTIKNQTIERYYNLINSEQIKED